MKTIILLLVVLNTCCFAADYDVYVDEMYHSGRMPERSAYSILYVYVTSRSDGPLMVLTRGFDVDSGKGGEVVVRWYDVNAWNGTPVVRPPADLGVVILAKGQTAVILVEGLDSPESKVDRVRRVELKMSPAVVSLYGCVDLTGGYEKGQVYHVGGTERRVEPTGTSPSLTP